jgi:hypothetical protein
MDYDDTSDKMPSRKKSCGCTRLRWRRDGSERESTLSLVDVVGVGGRDAGRSPGTNTPPRCINDLYHKTCQHVKIMPSFQCYFIPLYVIVFVPGCVCL